VSDATGYIEELGYAPRDGCKPEPEWLEDHAFVIARGVRPLALIGTFYTRNCCGTELLDSLRAVRGADDVVAFILPSFGGSMAYGYASHEWVVDFYRWALENAPKPYFDYILGLLCGYSPQAVSDFTRGQETD